ncbi:unnamed protein product, partial [Nesidiocoris tenuis]
MGGPADVVVRPCAEPRDGEGRSQCEGKGQRAERSCGGAPSGSAEGGLRYE